MLVQKIEGYNNIYEVSSFEKEFKEITNTKKKLNNRKSKPNRYDNWLATSLAQLDELGLSVLNSDNFEPVKGTSVSIYSIRYSHSKKNPRVLFYSYNSNCNKFILLHVFKEESGNNNKDYSKAVKIAEHRAKSIERSNLYEL